mmetsp:Transcript_4378/g.10711  ORF Transcript_4378/g.10711 Transcript_4378/m.10711 type:complete len:229 (+) Transcript_4378:1111-1797(+)
MPLDQPHDELLRIEHNGTAVLLTVQRRRDDYVRVRILRLSLLHLLLRRFRSAPTAFHLPQLGGAVGPAEQGKQIRSVLLISCAGQHDVVLALFELADVVGRRRRRGVSSFVVGRRQELLRRLRPEEAVRSLLLSKTAAESAWHRQVRVGKKGGTSGWPSRCSPLHLQRVLLGEGLLPLLRCSGHSWMSQRPGTSCRVTSCIGLRRYRGVTLKIAGHDRHLLLLQEKRK